MGSAHCHLPCIEESAYDTAGAVLTQGRVTRSRSHGKVSNRTLRQNEWSRVQARCQTLRAIDEPSEKELKNNPIRDNIKKNKSLRMPLTRYTYCEQKKCKMCTLEPRKQNLKPNK